MAHPDLGRPEPQRVHVDHGVDFRALLRRQMPCIETRADQPLLFLGKADKDVGVLPPRLTHTPKQAGKQRSSTPVVDYTIAGAYMIEVSAHQDDPVRLAR